MTRNQLRDLNFLGWLFSAAVFIIAAHVALARNHPRDFVYFYSIGHILNHYSPERLYDFALQTKVFNSVLPKHGFDYGPSPYPPFVALLFRPLALLPFWTAYLIWLLLSFAMYLTGIVSLVRRFYPNDFLRQSLLGCFAFSLWSVTLTLMAGQLSAIGFMAIALAICAEDAGWPCLSGLALAICSYKPTLLLLIVPMLLVTRRFRTLFGLLTGGLLVTAIATIMDGVNIWSQYLRFSANFSHLPFIPADHVDILTVSGAMAHGSQVGRWGLLILSFAAAVQLVRVWWLGSRAASPLSAPLLWGTTITWTLLLNVYTPLYDTSLVVISIIVTGKALTRYSRLTFILICVAAALSSYVTRLIAQSTGIQVFTLLLFALGTVQLHLCFRALSECTDPTADDRLVNSAALAAEGNPSQSRLSGPVFAAPQASK